MWKFFLSSLILIKLLGLQSSNGQVPLYGKSNTPVCAGSTLELYAACGMSYTWTGPNGWTSTEQNPVIPNAQPGNAGTYSLTMWDNDGVMHNASVSVVVNPRPVAEGGQDLTILYATYTILNGSASGGGGVYSYHWEPADLLVNPNIQNPATQIMFMSSRFYLTVTDQSTGCSSRKDSVVVNVIGGIGCSVSAVPTEICQGGFAHIKTDLFFDTIDHIYNWTSNPPGVISSFAEFNVNPQVTTTYYLETHSSWLEFYHAYDTVTVTVLTSSPQSIGEISGSESVCKGVKGILYVVQPVSDASSYQWMLPGGVTGHSTTNSITVEVGQDAVSGNISVSAKNACGLSAASTIEITFNSCPVEVKVDTFITCPGNQVLIPVKVKSFRDIGKFSLALNYDTANVSYAGYQNVNADILPVSVTNTPGSPSIITISSVTPFGVSIPDDEQLLKLVFMVKGGTTALTWNTAEPFNSKFYSPCEQLLPATLTNGEVNSGVQLTGHIIYDNITNSPLHGVHVVLKQNGIVKGDVVTDQNGMYMFADVCPGNYKLEAHSAQPWGGCNSIDALLILKHFVGISILEGLPLQAAETDASGYINSTDALLVLKRFTGLSNYFPTGDWIFETKSITISASNNDLDIKGLCVGDVNGSYNP